ncbi:MAG TPA: hypothetical protein VHB79_24415 [Polyangiaceae bacterium]|nr:hypothetical protein [Polyangiaceae bacterium]
MTPFRLFVCACALSVGVGCSSSPVTPDDATGGDGSGGSTGHAGSGGSGGKSPTPSCPKGTNPRGDDKPEKLGSVSGQIVDEQGQPTSSGLVQICGRDICINARVASNGKLAEQVDQTLDTPACKWGDGFEWAKLALPLAAGDTELGTLTTARLPDYSESVPLRAGQRATSGGISLTLAAKAQVVVNSLDYETEEQQGFRAVAIPPAALILLDPDFVAGYALSPLETRVCPNASLSLENTEDLAPGTALELYLLGLDVGETWAPYGQWLMIGEGAVSDDGMSLEFPDSVPLLTAVAVKVKP